MSAIALVLLKKGYSISGSDLVPNSLTDRLAKAGAIIYPDHKADNIKDSVDLIIYSSCIHSDNPEIKVAKARNIKTAPRGEILAELMSQKDGIAVCGCHGKTTTSGMIATILVKSGLDPTALIGGEVNFLASNARPGRGQYLVAEADESDGSFLALRPKYSVVTNIDEDHMEFFKDTKGLLKHFRQYILNIKSNGCFIYSSDDARLSELRRHCRTDNISFGFKDSAQVWAKDIVSSARILNSQKGPVFHTIFDCYNRSKKIGRFKISVPGIHNVSNALAAICVGLKLGLTADQIRLGLEAFTGTKRRFQVRGCFDGVTIVEDYAHHPREIMATLKAAEGFRPKRLIGVFQPHRFTRTLYLADRFSNCFKNSDYLVLTDVYSASEKAIKGVTGRFLYDKVRGAGHKKVVYIDKEKIADHLYEMKKPGDMILVLGAGDINAIADELVERLKVKGER